MTLCMHRRRCYLPVDLCAKEGVSQEDIYRGRPSEGLSNVVFQIASVAKVRTYYLIMVQDAVKHCRSHADCRLARFP